MEKILRIDNPTKFQKLLCFFNLYHSYKYWSGGRKEDDRYAHFRRCTNCNKLQIQTWYQSGCNMVENDWKKINIGDAKEPECLTK